jgi:hypothetical protein
MLSAQPAYALARATFKRAQRGLFGGKHIQFGNNVIALQIAFNVLTLTQIHN